ncbi:hypothetical protein PVK06_012169 [Gossypium arboreum]|uniref:Uncharacterized protein n=1 Tax=Gossypium arboreum TaxID=29729 RepID=A0ABR0QAT1_GOSAR|nr:hypothetical protein PVK06_012169 [Gossypium arboreum]
MTWLVMERQLPLFLSKVVAVSANPVLITRGIEKTTRALVSELKAISKQDVELLRKNEIIDNLLGNDEGVTQMFNKLGDSFYYSPEDFYYKDIANQVNKHCKRNWNIWKYSNYTQDSSGAYATSNAGANSLYYQQHYKKWANYYNKTEVSCAPGTENLPVASTSTQLP